jgi:hypothetical protein
MSSHRKNTFYGSFHQRNHQVESNNNNNDNNTEGKDYVEVMRWDGMVKLQK